ncbi:glycosyltransferase family 4 protein [Roseomonas sp. JC162]|uniref:Glycosyltransferase family 4 protein n=1 Tax=Neoroseomonas marina TaxID=1232220 RepID=A0A848EHE6_9PROT|nr:glycosyltransferase family 4 protein [Neoroseomonas marina]
MAPLRILLWYWGRRGAGAQITQALAAALARRPDVEVALSISAQCELRDGIEALGLPVDAVRTYSSLAGFAARLPAVPLLARRLRRQALEVQADAVVSTMTHLWTPLVAPGLKRAGLRYVPMVHDAEPHPGDPASLWEWRLGRELDAAAEAIVFSDSVAAGLRRRRPALPLHRLTLPAPVVPGADARPARPPADGPHFVHLGRLLPYKGIDLLRDAWPLLRRDHPDATLLVAGEGDPEALAPGIGALPGVTLRPGWLSEADLVGLLAAADAAVLPYREASQSGVVPVALALGVPAIVTPVGGLAEQVRDGLDGLVARAVSAEALAAAMAEACDAARLAALAAGARESAHRLADWKGLAARLVSILASGAGGTSRGAAGGR